MRILVIILTIMTNSINAQTYSGIVEDSLVTKFLTDITTFKNNSDNFNTKFSDSRILKWDTLNFLNDQDILGNSLFLKYYHTDTLFTSADIDFFKRQFLSQKDSVWRTKIKTTTFTPILGNEVSYNSYSLPLFSIDKRLAIIKRNYTCIYTNPCYQNFIDIYHKVDNEWRFLRHILYLTD
jgi:hypothetical protein